MVSWASSHARKAAVMGLYRNSHELTGHPPSFPVSPYSPSESESDSEAEHVLRAAPRRLSPAKNCRAASAASGRALPLPYFFGSLRAAGKRRPPRSAPPRPRRRIWGAGRGAASRAGVPPAPVSAEASLRTSYSHLLARSRGLLTVMPHRYLLHPAGRRRGGGIKWLELGTWARVYTLEKGRRLLEQTDGEEAVDGEMLDRKEHIAKSKSQISLDVAVCCQSKSIRTDGCTLERDCRIIEREMEEAYIAMALLSQQQPWTSNSSATRPPLCPALRAGAQD
ncbi:LOW QUALITY PROTEIN: hypothetical protein U9M48_004827, partial [Paspalum notatum var. saurae]